MVRRIGGWRMVKSRWERVGVGWIRVMCGEWGLVVGEEVEGGEGMGGGKRMWMGGSKPK